MSAERRELESLLPHRPPMLLLNRLVEGDPGYAVAEASVDAGDPLVESGRGLPSWALVEVFAQAAALIGGLAARSRGEAVAQGFLLGTRRLDCPVSHIPVGARFTVEARTAFTDGAGMGAYHCRVREAQWPVACTLSVYTPPADTEMNREPGNPEP